MAYVFSDFSIIHTAVRTAANSNSALFPTLETARLNLVSDLESKNLTAQAATAEQIYARAIANLENTQRELAQLAADCLLDRAQTLESFPEIPANPDVEDALRAIFENMVATPSTTPKNTVTVGGITKTTSGANTGSLYATKKLPGNIAPGPGLVAHYGLYDRDSELPDTDSVVAICKTAGALILSGLPAQNVDYGAAAIFGNPEQITLDTLGAGNLISNFFEAFTVANTPDDWSIVAGTAGVEILSSTSPFFIGSKSLLLNGTAEITYAIAARVAPRQMLLLSLWLRKHASTVAGTYTLRMTGTGMTTQTVTFNATDLSSSAWTEKTLHLKTPAVIPTDLKISLSTSGVSATGIYADGGLLQPYTYWAGIGWALTVGADAIAIGDRFSLALTNNYAGTLQTFFARIFGFQMPSA